MPKKLHKKIDGTEQHDTQSHAFRKWKLPFLIGSGAILVIVAAVAGYAFYFSSRYLPHTEIGGVAVGGMSRAQAMDALVKKQNNFLSQAITAHLDEKKWTFIPAETGTSFQNGPAIDDMWSQEKGGSLQHQIKQLLSAPFLYTRSEIGFTALSETGEKKIEEDIFKDIEIPYQEVSLAIEPSKVEIIPGKAGKKVNRNELELALYSAYKHDERDIAFVIEDFQPHLTEAQAASAKTLAETILADSWDINLISKHVTAAPSAVASWLTTSYSHDDQGAATALTLGINQDVLKKSVQEWAAQVNQKATNAQLGWDGASVSVTQDGKNGVAMDEVATAQAVSDAVLRYAGGVRLVTASVVVAEPDVRQATLATLGLTQRIGTSTTDYTGSPSNRKINITIGQQKLNGTLVKPGETYSTITNLGPITTEAGFVNELVIKDNRTTPEAGGGLCQVSTTLFRAVLNAGLPIVERQNHSYRVGYYERGVGPGLDATIYDPKPDFRWKNDLGYAVYVQSSVKGNTITFDLYGTGDGRVSTISAPEVTNITPSGNPIYINTDTLEVGQQKQVETPHDGATTVVQYTVMKDGKQLSHQTFKSVYKPWPAQYLVGTKPAAAPAQ